MSAAATGVGAPRTAIAGSVAPAGLRFDRLLPVAIVALVLVVAILTITPWPVGAFEDDAIYTVLAKALATGSGYRMLNLPGAPHATHYPPGYPFLLSLLWRAAPNFPDNIVVFKFANAVLLALTALGTWAFARVRLRLGRLGASAAALVGTLSIVVLLITGVILSEPMFMALLLPALLLAEQAAETGAVGTAIWAGLLLAALSLVRTLGAVAIPAAALVLLVRGHRRGAIALVVAGVLPLVPWQLWVNAYQHEVPAILMGKYGAYGPWLSHGYREGGLTLVREVVTANLAGVQRLFGYLVMPVTSALPRTIAFAGFVALALGGMAALLRRAPVTVLFLACYAGVVLVWPFEPDRFFLAVWPLLVITVVQVVAALWRFSPRTRPAQLARALMLLVAAIVIGGYAMYNARGYRQQWWASVQRDAGRGAKPIAEWVVRHSAMTDVLATEHDVMLYLYTGRPAIPVSGFLPRERVHALSPEENVEAIRTLLETYHPRYYITAYKPALQAADVLASEHPPMLRVVGNTTNALVYETIAR